MEDIGSRGRKNLGPSVVRDASWSMKAYADSREGTTPLV